MTKVRLDLDQSTPVSETLAPISGSEALLADRAFQSLCPASAATMRNAPNMAMFTAISSFFSKTLIRTTSDGIENAVGTGTCDADGVYECIHTNQMFCSNFYEIRTATYPYAQSERLIGDDPSGRSPNEFTKHEQVPRA